MLLEPIPPLSNGRLCLVMKHRDVTTFQVLSVIMEAVDLLLGHVHGGNVSHGWRGFHVEIPSCLTHCAKENTTLGQGNLTVERSESMSESTVSPIMGMSACWPFTQGVRHSPTLQLACVDPVSK